MVEELVGMFGGKMEEEMEWVEKKCGVGEVLGRGYGEMYEGRVRGV